MSDELLPYYQKELAFIRKMGAEFAEDFPEVAEPSAWAPTPARTPRGADDHAFALWRHGSATSSTTTSRRYRGHPGDPLPHYLSPSLPCHRRVRLDRAQAGLTEGYRVERKAPGDEPIEGRSALPHHLPITLWPIEVASASLQGCLLPGTMPEGTTAVLKLELKCFAET